MMKFSALSWKKRCATWPASKPTSADVLKHKAIIEMFEDVHVEAP